LVFLNLIAAVLLLVLAEPIVRLLFERGAFKPEATQRVALALMCLAPGLVAFSAVNILARAFFALGDTKTPMKISIVCLTLNLVFAAALIVPFRQGGLGIANTMTSICNVTFLAFALRKKLKTLEWRALKATILPLTIAGALAAVTAYSAWHLWEHEMGHRNLALKIGAVFVPAALAGAVYWVIGIVGEIPAAHEILQFVFAKFLPKRAN
jgi:putative peptidoglycan lipid II flippase